MCMRLKYWDKITKMYMYSLKMIFELYNKILQLPLLIFSVNRKSTD